MNRRLSRQQKTTVVFGILAFLTFWPSVALILSGLARARPDRNKGTGSKPGPGHLP